MMFGDRTDYAEAARIVASAREAGVNFIDTADMYAKSESEKIVGKLIAEDRDHWVLATKVGNPMGAGPNERGTGTQVPAAGHRRRASSGSAPTTSTSTTCTRISPTSRSRRRSGRWATSSPRARRATSASRISAAGASPRWCGVCGELGVAKPVVCQPYYNAMNRQPEAEILPACHHHGIGVAPYSPLARGVLVGKYKPGEAPPADTRAGRNDKRIMETEFRAESLVMAQTLKAHALKKGMSATQFAFGWVLANRIVTSVIAGPRTLEQWEGYLGALDRPIDAEDEAVVDSLVRTGHPSTPGYNDPAYPLTGRLLGT